MKKVFLTLAVSLMTLASTAQLQLNQLQPLTPSENSPIKVYEVAPEANTANKAAAPFKAEGETLVMDYAPSGSPYAYTGLTVQSAGMKMAQALQITKSACAKFAGNSIYKLYFYTGYNDSISAAAQSYVNTIKEATLFLTYDVRNFEPFYTQNIELSSQGKQFTEVLLDTPYLIEEDKPVYIGYYYTLTAEDDVTFVFDGLNHGNDVSGGWYGYLNAPTDDNPNPKWAFSNAANQLGFFCLGASIMGTQMPQNELSASNFDIPLSVYQNSDFEVKFDVENMAANVINSFEIEVKVGENEAFTEKYDITNQGGVHYGYSGTLRLELSYDVASKDAIPVTVTVTKVNGVENNSTSKTVSGNVLIVPEGLGFDRNIVVEEFTGTWCGYCPQGIVTMEKLRETYTDGSVIPIAIHFNDEMYASTYSTIINRFNSSGNAPYGILNRMQNANIYSPAPCIALIDELKSYPATAQVTATAKYADDMKSIIFNTHISFSFDNDDARNNYALAFGVFEDNVGPYNQTNYYTPAQAGKLDGWNHNTSKVKMYFNDVARQYTAINKSVGAIPETVKAGEVYDYEYTMPFAAKTTIGSYSYLSAVVYLLNRKTSVVENAYLIKTADISSINEIAADSAIDENAPVEYYNLQGMRVAQPESGLYIVRQGNNAKVVRIN